MATTQVQDQSAIMTDTSTRAEYDRAVAVDRIVDEAGCSATEAESMLVWLERLLDQARKTPGSIVFPTDEQMWTPEYYVFDAVMGHYAVAPAGSAHEAMQTALLDASAGELTIGHAQRNEDGEVGQPGEQLYCTVTVGVGVFR